MGCAGAFVNQGAEIVPRAGFSELPVIRTNSTCFVFRFTNWCSIGSVRFGVRLNQQRDIRSVWSLAAISAAEAVNRLRS